MSCFAKDYRQLGKTRLVYANCPELGIEEQLTSKIKGRERMTDRCSRK